MVPNKMMPELKIPRERRVGERSKQNFIAPRIVVSDTAGKRKFKAITPDTWRFRLKPAQESSAIVQVL